MTRWCLSFLMGCMLPLSSLQADNVSDLLDKIANTSHQMEYYFFPSQKGNYFLATMRDGKMKVWRYAEQKRWQPVHNAGAFDGFEGAEDMFGSVAYDKGQVTFGETIAKDDGKAPVSDPGAPPPLPNQFNVLSTISAMGQDLSVKEYAEELKSGNFKVTHYFWKITEGEGSDQKIYPFLVKTQDISNLSLYYLTADKKWKPLYNAKAFDGFDEVGETIGDISFDPATLELEIGAKKEENMPGGTLP